MCESREAVEPVPSSEPADLYFRVKPSKADVHYQHETARLQYNTEYSIQ